MRQGRRPTPEEIKRLKGVQPCRLNADAPVSPKGADTCPDYLDGYGREAWEWMTLRLAEMNVLSKADSQALALYCSAYSRWRRMNELVEREGEVITTATTVKPHPAIQVGNEAQRQMTKLLIEFGMTPSARSSIKANGQSAEDPLLDFISKRA